MYIKGMPRAKRVPPVMADRRESLRVGFARTLNRLKRDIAKSGLSLTTIYKTAGVQVSAALRGAPSKGGLAGVGAPPSTLRPETLLRLIKVIGADEDDYAAYLRLAAPTVGVVCSICGEVAGSGGKHRTPTQLAFTRILNRLQKAGARLPRVRPDGFYSLPLGYCATKLALKKHWSEYTPSDRRNIPRRQIGVEGKKKQRAWAAGEKGAATRTAMSRARTHLAAMKVEGLGLCRLCQLVLHIKASASDDEHWHRMCHDRWQSWVRQHPDAKLGQRVGRPPELDRNYRILMLIHWEQRRTRRKILSEVRIHPYSEYRPSRPAGDLSTVSKAPRALIRLLPGSWELVFSPRGVGIEKREIAQRANAERQASLALPDALRPFIEAGDRDRLMLRLHAVGMPELEIAQLTGASEERVLAVIEGATDAARLA